QDRLAGLEEDVQEIKGGNQPGNQLTVWKNGGPGSKKVAQLVKKALKRPPVRGVKTREVAGFLERSNRRALDIMQELGEKHPDLKYVEGKGNKSARICRKSS
ncbi:MAG: hypothetical protein ABEJ98_05150, partial [Candidatus Nanohaloarchaea archaeon]